MDRKLSKPARGAIAALAHGMAALLLMLALAPRLALAHAELEASTPANGSTIQPGLTELTLIFSEEISIDQSSAELIGPGVTMMSGAHSTVDRANRKKMTIQTSALQSGKYTVKWQAVTEDDNGHSNGTFAFTVAASGTASQTGMSVTPINTGAENSMPPTGAGDQPWRLAFVLALALVFTWAGVLVRRGARA